MASRRKQKKRHGYRQDEERRFTVRGVRREPPDIRKFSKALISLTMAEAERQAQAEHAAGHDTKSEPAAEERATPGGAADG
ncbi:MAG: hypothetical protein ACRDTE_10930 [Pseudonocardiaceae bacterium]